MSRPNPPIPALPLFGRARELELLHALLDDAGAGRGRTLLLTGESGVGKSRLAKAAADEAARRGWTVATGRAYAVETGMPYAPVSDAMTTVLQTMSPEKLAILTRGDTAALGHLFPALRDPDDALTPAAARDSSEFKSRLLWNFHQLLSRMSAKDPILVVLDDLQWADSSSLELLHFVARQIEDDRIAILATLNDDHLDDNPALPPVVASLRALGAEAHPLRPLSREETAGLLAAAFGVGESSAERFGGLLHRWTTGNPFFIEETLKALAAAERIRLRDGVWLGWEAERLELPSTVREVVLERLQRLSPPARALAEDHAVLGTSARYDVLLAISDMAEPEMVHALEELRREHVLVERLQGEMLAYDFRHQLLRETILAEMGLARTRMLHGRIAVALESFYGEDAPAKADELAVHFVRADQTALAPRAVRYLAKAGRAALERFSYREAADYLGAALEQRERARPEEEGDEEYVPLIEALARARQRLGEFDAATALWVRALAAHQASGDAAGVARVHRRLALAARWSGRLEEAIAHFDVGLASAGAAGDVRIEAGIRLARSEALLALGRGEEARAETAGALRVAEALGVPELVARAHLSSLLLHTWIGPPKRARESGEKGLALALEAGDPSLACTFHWGLAVLGGLTGDGERTGRHIAECERIADELGSPFHRLWIAEVEIEHREGRGEWDEAVALAERSIHLARVFNQRTLLPRLLVWAGLIHCGRGELERGRAHVDEAWALSGAAEMTPDRAGHPNVHSVIPAHCGRAGYHLWAGEYAEAVRVGEAGLAVADRSGYGVWAIHRLLPVMLEASLWAGEMETARRLRDRLEREARRLGHRLGLAWVAACDAILAFLGGDVEGSLPLLRAAAEKLEAIPFIPDGARVRRQLAARLRDAGDREGALRELRHVHDVFDRLGAARELEHTREQIRELGGRPPVRRGGPAASGLTPRETDIVRLVLERRSNKAIGRSLGISARTVSTHLTNIFRKLEVGSRGELADRARTMELPAQNQP